MQVLVLAVQNAVPYELLGVATSGSTLFRQIGGSIGVSIFGAIFANQLASNLAKLLPPGVHAPTHATPGRDQAPPGRAARALPRRVRAVAPTRLRGGRRHLGRRRSRSRGSCVRCRCARAPRQTASPRRTQCRARPSRCPSSSGSSRRSRSTRTAGASTAELADRADVELDPAELWLIARLGEGTQVAVDRPDASAAYTSLHERGLVDGLDLTPDGERVYARVVDARREALGELLDGWDTGQRRGRAGDARPAGARARRPDPRVTGSVRSRVLGSLHRDGGDARHGPDPRHAGSVRAAPDGRGRRLVRVPRRDAGTVRASATSRSSRGPGRGSPSVSARFAPAGRSSARPPKRRSPTGRSALIPWSRPMPGLFPPNPRRAPALTSSAWLRARTTQETSFATPLVPAQEAGGSGARNARRRSTTS